ncbi:MAG: GTPase ObgE [bacterium]|jgi:GTP-binding protein
MFIDKVKIFVRGGDGGNGCVAFRREKYVPEGGPNGGDGGKGGDVIFFVDPGARTLLDFRYQGHYKAGRGEHGMGKGMHGRAGDSLRVAVPPGTLVYDAESGELIADLIRPEEEAVAARGGRGGRGNPHFVSAVNRAPRMAEKGEPGEERWLRLELKLLADVGLVGLPNAGKSMLLSTVSEAKPKIADYPFTTLSPNLGVVKAGDGRSFVMADIPGLIEGAHAGAGLGHEFLRHIERTKVLVHVVDASGFAGQDPLADYAAVDQELKLYDPALAERPQIVALNKIDLTEARDIAVRLAGVFRDRGLEVFLISAATGEGVREMIYRVADLLAAVQAEAVPPAEKDRPEKIYRARPSGFSVRRADGIYVIEGEDIERIVAMTDFENEEAVRRFQNILRKMGISAALREKGLKDGDAVSIRGIEFAYTE